MPYTMPKRTAIAYPGLNAGACAHSGVTENVSLHGARVMTVRSWQAGTRVLVTFLWDGVRSEGRVAYCQRKESGDFANGVELSGHMESRLGNLA